MDADAVDLWRAAGAVILGKTSTHEFALGVTSPQARNPHDPTRIPGGSSGGCAIAVATGMGLASLGTDTRASIRVPAALCGVVGLKPTYGTVPTRGVVPLSWTMDHVAVMARHRRGRGDRAGRAASRRHRDRARRRRRASATCASGSPPPPGRAPRPPWSPRWPRRSTSSAAWSPPSGRPTVRPPPTSAARTRWACSSRAARRRRSTALAGLDRSLYWAEVRDQLDAADGVLATDYIDAQRYRAALREEMLAVFREHHVLAMPTAPVLAPPVERADEYLTILSRNAILWSFVGFPAISVPCPTEGLPVGLQLVAGPGGEALLIALATSLTKGDA